MRDDGFVPGVPGVVGRPAGVSVLPTQRRVVSQLVPGSRAGTDEPADADATDRPPARVLAFRPSPVAAPASNAVDEQARAQGFAAGYAAGAREAARVAESEARRVSLLVEQDVARRAVEHERSLEILARAAAAAQQRTQPVLEQVERRLHLAAVELAQALLGVELSDAETSGRAALARVLGNPRLPETVTVRLHPRDLDALHAAGVDVALADGVTLAADPALAPGDAVAEHPDGLLDARLGEALTRALDALLELT